MLGWVLESYNGAYSPLWGCCTRSSGYLELGR